MGEVCGIGLDIAKEYFQVLGVDNNGKDMFNRKLKRKIVAKGISRIRKFLPSLN